MKTITMKTILFFLLLILTVFAAGCLGGDDGTDNSADSANDTPSGGNISGNELNYSTSIVTVHDVPSGYEFLSTQSVKSHGEDIGMTDILYGYRGYYKFTNETVTNVTVYFYCFKTNSSADASKYIQQMNDSYTNSYSTADLSSVQLNGHNAVKYTTVSEDESASGPDMIAWTRGNLLFVVKGQTNGEVDYADLETLVKASKL